MTTSKIPEIEDEIIETIGILLFSKSFTRVLLVENLAESNHVSHTWGIPAGVIYKNQSPSAFIAQKLLEETGLTVDVGDLTELPFEYIAKIPRKDGSTKKFHLKNFVCLKFSGELLQDSLKNRPRWINVKNLTKLNLLPNVNQMIADAVEFRIRP